MLVEVIKGEDGKYPYDTYNKKQKKTTSLIIWLLGIITSLIVLSAIQLGIVKFIIIAVVAIFGVFCLSMVLAIICNPFLKTIRKFNKDVNFVEFEKEIYAFLQEPLHSQTRINVLLNYINVLFTVDQEKAFQMFPNVKEPTANILRPLYSVIEICCCFNDEYYDEGIRLFEIFKKTYSKNHLQIRQLEVFLQIVMTTDEIIDIAKKLPINTKNKFNNLVNANNLMRYYFKRDNIESAKVYAQFIINNGKQLTEIYNKAYQLLNNNQG